MVMPGSSLVYAALSLSLFGSRCAETAICEKQSASATAIPPTFFTKNRETVMSPELDNIISLRHLTAATITPFDRFTTVPLRRGVFHAS
jgi:hypothetical protein